MVEKRRHIALVLLGVFIFPIAYQPYHTVRHHSKDLHCHHNCSHAKQEKPAGLHLDVFSAKKEHCSICEYHFPVNDLPKLFFFTSATSILKSSNYELKIKRAYQQVVSTKTPRAPPLCI